MDSHDRRRGLNAFDPHANWRGRERAKGAEAEPRVTDGLGQGWGPEQPAPDAPIIPVEWVRAVSERG